MNQHYYGGWIDYWNDNKSISGVGWGSDTLEKCYEQLDGYLGYYSDLGYEIKEYSITQNCLVCNNSGLVKTGKRVKRMKPCPHCKGKPELKIIETWRHWRCLRSVKESKND